MPWRETVVMGSLIALAMGIASVASSEVRVRTKGAGNQSSLELEVHVGPQGIWHAHGQVDARTLNPTGDDWGDGVPGWSVAGGRLRVAWTRQAQSRLVLTETAGENWEVPFEADAPGAIGIPRPIKVASTVGAVWQKLGADGRSSVAVTLWSDDGLIAETTWVGGGRLVSALAQGTSIDVVSLDEDGELAWRRLRFAAIRPVPQPIDVEFLVLDRIDLRLAGARPWEPLPLVTPMDVVDSAETPTALVSWWPAPGELSFAEFGEDGLAYPIETLHHPGQADRPRSLQREAEQIVRDRHE